MREDLTDRKHCRIRSAIICLILLLTLLSLHVAGSGPGKASEADEPVLRADHHMHVASPELCRLVAECLPSYHPPAVFAADAIRALDQAHVSKGVILSCAYLYGLPSLHLKSREIAELTRRENEFTAAQVAQYPTRLVGFLSVNPLQDSAIEEIRNWQGSRQLIGLKLHFTASAVDNHTCAIHPPLSSHPPDILEKLLKLRIGCAMGIRKDLLVTEEIAESSRQYLVPCAFMRTDWNDHSQSLSCSGRMLTIDLQI